MRIDVHLRLVDLSSPESIRVQAVHTQYGSRRLRVEIHLTLEIDLMDFRCVYLSSTFVTPRIDTLYSLSHHAYEPVPQAIVGSDPRSVSPWCRFPLCRCLTRRLLMSDCSLLHCSLLRFERFFALTFLSRCSLLRSPVLLEQCFHRVVRQFPCLQRRLSEFYANAEPAFCTWIYLTF